MQQHILKVSQWQKYTQKYSLTKTEKVNPMRCKTSGAQQFQIAFESSLTQKATELGWSILALRWNYGDRFRRAVVTKQRKWNIHDLPHSNEHNIHPRQCLSRAQSTDCTRLELNRWRWLSRYVPEHTQMAQEQQFSVLDESK